MSDLRSSLAPNAPGGSRLAISRGILEGYFSAPIAKAIAGAAAKSAARAGVEESSQWDLAFDRELGRLLAVYLPDAGRRMECVSQLAVTWHSRPSRERQREEPRPIATHSSRPAAIGAASTSVVVSDQSDIPNACEVVRDLGKKLGFSRVDQTKMATAVSELARNMLQYAGGGTIRFAEVLAPRRGLEAFFEDSRARHHRPRRHARDRQHGPRPCAARRASPTSS